jgi:hypothetical protein
MNTKVFAVEEGTVIIKRGTTHTVKGGIFQIITDEDATKVLKEYRFVIYDAMRYVLSTSDTTGHELCVIAVITCPCMYETHQVPNDDTRAAACVKVYAILVWYGDRTIRGEPVSLEIYNVDGKRFLSETAFKTLISRIHTASDEKDNADRVTVAVVIANPVQKQCGVCKCAFLGTTDPARELCSHCVLLQERKESCERAADMLMIAEYPGFTRVASGCNKVLLETKSFQPGKLFDPVDHQGSAAKDKRVTLVIACVSENPMTGEIAIEKAELRETIPCKQREHERREFFLPDEVMSELRGWLTRPKNQPNPAETPIGWFLLIKDKKCDNCMKALYKKDPGFHCQGCWKAYYCDVKCQSEHRRAHLDRHPDCEKKGIPKPCRGTIIST